MLDGIDRPAGLGWLPDGESFGARLTAFTITADGELVDRRVWASLKPATPDGLCLDAAGAAWLASPTTGEVLRVLEGGAITHRIATAEQPLDIPGAGWP